MRVAFMGTPALSAVVLRRIAAAFDVVAAYTRPDAVRGRGKALVPSPVKQAAAELGIPVLTPRTLRDAAVQAELAAFSPDVVCVAAYGALLPAEVLCIPAHGCVNVHASLLPRWRGAAPIERAVLAGDERTGVCIMRMEEGLDTGAYCVRKETPVDEKTARALTEEIADLGAEGLVEALHAIERGDAVWVEQAEEGVTYAQKLEPGELNASPDECAQAVSRKARAASDAHASRCTVAGRPVALLDARVAPDAVLQPGQVLFRAKRLYLGCADGAVELLGVRPDGKRAMDAGAFAAGIQGVKSGDLRWDAL